MCRPEGTLEFDYVSETLFDPAVPQEVIFELSAGAHIFQLLRNERLELVFYHSSPGTGTRVATVDLNSITPCSRVYIALVWSPSETMLYVGPRIAGGKLVRVEGVPSPVRLRVGQDGHIYRIGDAGVEVGHYSMHLGGRLVLQPTAIEAWRNTIQALEVLKKAKSEDGYAFEVILSNFIIVALVTGFETYCRTRFLELESEGVTPDLEAMMAAFCSRLTLEDLKREAASENRTVLQKMAEWINFQNYGQVKKAYRKAYGIRFGEIGVSSSELALLQRLIHHRHRVVHFSPWTGQLPTPSGEPEFSNLRLVEKAITCFDRFVARLHEATLGLRPSK
ncbi:hypothetical protein Desku_2322 [Desulfofundulus kuznetsovii DSM 6115]|uniref:Uncharacterized protein n=2 Tax=Desulfofundulus kuznetsovii TaxID=58135 RepID=A0AAU8PCW1_DESK7|nr:hypothetical protein Desku_2322 [Desulfofundulus kuznetsovii DSM 6115]